MIIALRPPAFLLPTLLLVMATLWLLACGPAGTTSADPQPARSNDMTQPANVKTPTATIETSEGNITVEFWPDVAPNHVQNFLDLSRKGFYNGVIFHRVIPGFMIQGGDPTGTGTGSNGNTRLKAEFNTRPDRKHTRGVLSMARSSDPNSASCQFFIMHQDSTHLDGQYSAFGKVTSGIEVVDKIVSVPTGPNDRPKNPPKIIKITINE